MQKNVTKSEEKKLTNSIKLDLLSCCLIPLIFKRKIHWDYYFCDVLSKLEQFLNLFVNKLFGVSLLKMSTKSEEKKTPHIPKICPRELSFQTINIYKKIHLVY